MIIVDNMSDDEVWTWIDDWVRGKTEHPHVYLIDELRKDVDIKKARMFVKAKLYVKAYWEEFNKLLEEIDPDGNTPRLDLENL